MRKILTKIILILFLFISILANSKSIQLTNQSKISILTCGTSKELHSLFGHTGIRIQDDLLGIDLVYNYGAFDYSEPNFYGRFIKGDLLYFIGLDDFNSFLFNYKMENRSVWEQPLNISLTQKQNIFNELVETYGTDKALYTYKFIDKNCTTLAAELIEKHIGKKLNSLLEESNKTNRVILNEYLKNAYIPGFGINLAFGNKTDETFSHIFLPKQLLESIEITKIDGKPLSDKTITHFEASESKSFYFGYLFIFSTTFLIVGFLCMYKNFCHLFNIILGIFGVFMFVLQFYSFHKEVHLNYNLLILNPLYLLLVFYNVTNQLKKYKSVLFIIICCSTLYLALVLFNGFVSMVLPIIIGIIISLYLQWRFMILENKKGY